MLAGTCVVLAETQQDSYGREIRVVVNGDRVQFDGTGPQKRNDRVLVPLRGVLEKIGASVDWNAETQTVLAEKEGMKILLKIGSSNPTVNGRRVHLDVPAMTIDGTTLVPLRFLSESLGADVKWNDQTSTVSVNTGQPEPNIQQEDRQSRRNPARSGRPEVTSVSTDFGGEVLKAGQRIHMTMRATAGGRGYFRIRGLMEEQRMTETSPGVYELSWRSPENRDHRVDQADFLAHVVIGSRATTEKSPGLEH